MTTTCNINLSAEAPVFNVTLGENLTFSVSTVTTGQPLAHQQSHSIGGTDRILPEDIGAQGLFDTGTVTFTGSSSVSVTLAASRAKTWNISVFAPGAFEVILPSTGKLAGDIAVIRAGAFSQGATFTVKIQHNGYTTPAATLLSGQSVRFVSSNTSSSGWAQEPVSIHTHLAADITDFTAAVTAIVNAIRPL
jgi:hypothetical protein